MKKLLFYSNSLISLIVTGLIICTMVISSCSKTEVAVQTDTPQAVQQLVEDYKRTTSTGCGCHPYIKHYVWRNENVYMTGINDALNIGFVCDWIPTFYNSKGERFEIDGSYSYDRFQDFLRTARFIKTVWACE